eukprot:766507-Hanusia_phi.AAC.5
MGWDGMGWDGIGERRRRRRRKRKERIIREGCRECKEGVGKEIATMTEYEIGQGDRRRKGISGGEGRFLIAREGGTRGEKWRRKSSGSL